MIVEHLGKTPDIHPTAYIAPNAAVCGDVTVGENSRILFGASIVAEGGGHTNRQQLHHHGKRCCSEYRPVFF